MAKRRSRKRGLSGAPATHTRDAEAQLTYAVNDLHDADVLISEGRCGAAFSKFTSASQAFGQGVSNEAWSRKAHLQKAHANVRELLVTTSAAFRKACLRNTK